ncbi:MAG TPA: carboxypeptidase regulatory-like domain-containing protein, partial [Alphaproteobacteria bacterium]|nr:carboxypeptidase regulatory-like domain-containing protein [Alphaproteobacteria bacterium]
VPYIVAIGNHDYNAADPWNRTSSATNYNHYFGPSRFANSYSGWLGSYPTGSNENSYYEITVNGQRYLILSLEFYPRTSALQWAKGIIEQNADAEIIIVTHGYEYFDNTHIALCDNYNAEYYNMGTDNDGEEMWTKIVSQYANISMVFSGHIVKSAGQMAAAHQTEAGVNGNIVNEMLANGQAMTDGGQGYLRILQVSSAQNQIRVSTYSPYLNAYMTDSANAFTVPWHATSTTEMGAITGRVRNTSCGAIAGAQVSVAGGSTTTSSSGSFTLSNLPAGIQTVTVEASGYPTTSKDVTVGHGLTNSALFFLSASPSPTPTPTPTPTPPPSGCTATTVGVTVCSPILGSTVNSPVRFTAAAKSTLPITAMRIYIDNVSAYAISAANLDVSLAVTSGTHNVVVQAWDSNGAVFKASPITLTVTQGSPGPCSAVNFGVTVCVPAPGATVSSPVRVTAAAKSATGPITAMRIYVDNVSRFDSKASSLDTTIALATGAHSVVVQAWDSTGAVFKTSLTIQVQ